GRFKEQKHQINPNRLSVVAFLQDNQTKAILQAVYVKAPPAANEGSRKRRRSRFHEGPLQRHCGSAQHCFLIQMRAAELRLGWQTATAPPYDPAPASL